MYSYIYCTEDVQYKDYIVAFHGKQKKALL